MTTSALLESGGRALWFGNGAHFKGAVVLLCAALLVRAFARASAATRHLVLVLGFAGMLLASLGAWLLPGWTPDAVAWLAPAPVTSPSAALGALPALARSSLAAGASTADFSATLLAHLPTAFLVVWALGALALTARVGLDLMAARRLAARTRPLDSAAVQALTADLAGMLGLRAPPALRVSEAIDGPAAVGLRRPVVILPATFRDWTADQLRGVLAHELAHAARHDCAAQAFARLVSALHWPNPLVWWASRCLVTEREMAADDAALRVGAVASEYAGFLLHLAAGSQTRPRGALSMTDGSALGERISRLLDPVRSHAAVSPRRAALATVGVLASALALGCFGGAERVRLTPFEGRSLVVGAPHLELETLLVLEEMRAARFDVCVDVRGQVTDVHVLHLSPPGTGASVVTAVRGWPHRPYEKDGAAVPYCYLMRIEVARRDRPAKFSTSQRSDTSKWPATGRAASK